MYNGMLVPTKAEGGKGYFVLKKILPHLIKERRIQKVHRSEGWLDIEDDQRKDDEPRYSGAERRGGSVLDWTLFPLSIEQQLHRGQSLEAILGYGGKARAIAFKFKLKNVAKTNFS